MKRIVGAFSLVLLCSLSVYSQNNKIIYDEYGPIYTSMNDSIIVYNTKEGKQLEIKRIEQKLINFIKQRKKNGLLLALNRIRLKQMGK